MVSVADAGGPLSMPETDEVAAATPRRKALIILPLLTGVAAIAGAFALLGGSAPALV